MEFTRSRLAKEVVEKVEDLLEQGLTFSQIVKQTGVSKGSISKIKNGTYKKVPLIMDYIDEKEYAMLKEENQKLKEENEMLRTSIESLKKNINDFQKLDFYINKLGSYTRIITKNKINNINNINGSINNYNPIDDYELINDYSFIDNNNNIDSTYINEQIINLWRPLNLSTSNIAMKLGLNIDSVIDVIRDFNEKYPPDLKPNLINIFKTPEKEYTKELCKKIIYLYKNNKKSKDEISRELVLSISYVNKILELNK